MTLKRKTFLILLVSSTVTFIALMFYLQVIIFKAFEGLENRHYNNLANQAASVLLEKRKAYTAFVKDWAIWDDTYDFIKSKNPKYIKSNLRGSTLEDLGIETMIFTDKNFNLVHLLSLSYFNSSAQKVYNEVYNKREKLRNNEFNLNPVIYIPLNDGRFFMAAIHPILPTNEDKDRLGYLILGRMVDDDFFKDLENTSHTSFSVKRGQSVVGNFTLFNKVISESKILNEYYVQLKISVVDIDNRFLEFSTQIKREFRTQMYNIYRHMLYAMMVVIAIIILITMFMLDKFVLRKIVDYINRFRQLGESGHLTVRLPVDGTKELQEFARTANWTLERIKKLMDEKDEREKELHELSEKLEELSKLDGLTSLPNRRYFDETYEKEWKRAHREKTPLSVLMIDLDFFKKYNDTYGHLAGDASLIKVGDSIRENMKRPTDFIARFGGEEFICILPDTDVEGARHIADDINRSIKDLKITNTTSHVSDFITVSIGVATAVPDENSHKENLIKRADEALYKAKSERDSVVVASITRAV